MTRDRISDRFWNWTGALDDSQCTRECGAAVLDVCRCRCQGLFHNAGHDYWARLPRETLTVLPGGSTIRSVNHHAPVPHPASVNRKAAA